MASIEHSLAVLEKGEKGIAAGSEKSQKTHACETCGMRRKAEENPKALMSRLWKFHTKFCPGWKQYQAYLVSQKQGPY